MAPARAVEYTKLADMSQLVATPRATIGAGVSLDMTLTGTVYNFDGTNNAGILNISNDTILNTINGGSGYLTIAAWIRPGITTGDHSIFSVGGQNDGFKFAVTGNKLQFTTKGVLDTSNGPTVTANEWMFVR